MKKRQKKPSLPSTVTELATEEGSKVYVVGTAHFSDSSKRDVVKVTDSKKCCFRVSNMGVSNHHVSLNLEPWNKSPDSLIDTGFGLLHMQYNMLIKATGFIEKQV